jgi:hypothetical protein
MSVAMQFKGRCVGGTVNLSRYPNLAHSESKGVFTHLAGVSIEDVVKEVSGDSYLTPNSVEVSVIEILDYSANMLGVTLDELLDAVRYARANKLV